MQSEEQAPTPPTKEVRKKRVMFVDDLNERYERFKELFPDVEHWHVKTADDAIECLHLFGADYGGIDEIWLDHDAGELIDPSTDRSISLTFRPVAVTLALMRFQGKVKLHSMNPEGRKWMEEVLKSRKVSVENNTDADVRRIWGVN